MKKGLILILCLMFLVLQYRLWVGQGSLRDVWRLETAILGEQKGLAALTKRNQLLDADVK